jgi:O26-antigen biosynthesis N-acetyl-L-fucosamine transferase
LFAAILKRKLLNLMDNIMKVAFLVDEYLPTGTRVHSKMIHQLAMEFQRNGHESVVITPGDPTQDSSLIIDFLNGVEVWRFKSGYIRGVGMAKRLINEWMLSYKAWNAVSKEVNNRCFDLCINYSPTIFFGPFTRRLKVKGTYIYQVLRDDFPQWLVDQEIISKWSPVTFFMRYYERLNYRTADCIGMMSEANVDVFKKRNPSYSNVTVLANWSSTQPFRGEEISSNILTEYNLSAKTVFFYGGNLGHSNDMPNIIRLARNLNSYQNAHFLIIGQGDQYDLINELVDLWDLENVTVLPSISQDAFQKVLTKIDIGLFSLSKNHTTHNFPGKLLGYMVESIPILGSTNPGNDLLTLVNNANAGFIHVNGDDDSLAASAIELMTNNALRLDCGINARALLMKYFSVKSAFQNIISEMDVDI